MLVARLFRNELVLSVYRTEEASHGKELDGIRLQRQGRHEARDKAERPFMASDNPDCGRRHHRHHRLRAGMVVPMRLAKSDPHTISTSRGWFA
jgi:hypothetical protein